MNSRMPCRSTRTFWADLAIKESSFVCQRQKSFPAAWQSRRVRAEYGSAELRGDCSRTGYAVASGAPAAFERYRRIVSIIDLFAKPASISSISTVRPERIPWISTSAYMTSRVSGSFK